MPMINLKITQGESTVAQKAQVIEEMTEVLQRVMGKTRKPLSSLSTK